MRRPPRSSPPDSLLPSLTLLRSNVLAGNGDRAVLDIVEAVEKPRNVRFSCSRLPDNGSGLAVRHVKGNTFQDRPVRIIGEMHVPESDRALSRLERSGVRSVLHFRLDLQQVEHLLNIRQALADFAIDEADEIDRKSVV